FRVDAAGGGSGDPAVVGKSPLRRQPIARLQGSAGNIGGDRVGKADVFKSRHNFTQSKVLLAPIQLQDHVGFHKPEIAPRRREQSENKARAPFRRSSSTAVLGRST